LVLGSGLAEVCNGMWMWIRIRRDRMGLGMGLKFSKNWQELNGIYRKKNRCNTWHIFAFDTNISLWILTFKLKTCRSQFSFRSFFSRLCTKGTLPRIEKALTFWTKHEVTWNWPTWPRMKVVPNKNRFNQLFGKVLYTFYLQSDLLDFLPQSSMRFDLKTMLLSKIILYVTYVNLKSMFNLCLKCANW